MKNAFNHAAKIYKYAAVICTIGFWIYMIIDDYVFIEERGLNLESIIAWFAWFIGLDIILIYHKLIRRTRQLNDLNALCNVQESFKI
ncbi:MAG: hypothetical protein HYZ42_10295 [Bacteroidetes bacterium]|nr:hypothetical protein [Bacteroidota bacterium]